MGQVGSKLLSEQKQLQKSYTIDNRLKEENLTFLTSKENGQQYLLREIIYNEEPEYLEMLKKLQQRKTIKSPYITQLKRVENFKQENLCSKYYRIYTLWEYPRKTLAEQINDRALLKQPFEEFQLRTLLLHISQGLAAFQQNRKGHQCLTTKTILTPQRFNSKVVDILAYPLHPNLDVVYHKRSVKNIYLSPEQCQIIQNQSFNHLSSDPFKQDVFVGGMIMIECALLQRQQDCYENDYETINIKRIGQRLDIVESKYGRQLRLIIESMLHPITANRVSWKQLVQRLNSDRATGYEAITVKVIEPIIREPIVRQSFPVRSLVQTQKVAVTPPTAQLRNSFAFSYNPNQIERAKPLASQRIQQVTYVNRPIIHNFQPQKVTSQLRPQTVKFNNSNTKYIVHSHLKSVRPYPNEAVTIQSKFTPIALETTKYKQINQTMLPGSINVNVVRKEPIVRSPQIKEQKKDIMPPQVKNFSLNISDPIFCIDEYGEGKKYEGYKLNGKKQGEGSFFLDGKLCFQGQWKDDMMEGQGRLYYHSGIVAYEGKFEKDRFHGFGKLYNQYPQKLQGPFNYQDFDQIQEYWLCYEGQFEDDLKQGKGQLFLSNGDQFSGNFHKDSVQGQGVYKTKEGQVIRGIWSENKLLKLIT